MEKKYTIGLDIGTNSVGWAVIDDSFTLAQTKKIINDNGEIHKSKTNLWGVRLFEEGQVAADCRIKRGQRRRLTRRHERLNYLRGIFEEELYKIDDSFFIRLDESFYQMEDKKQVSYRYRDQDGYLQTREIQHQTAEKYPLFKTEQAEKAYYAKYPTIYHLRKHLMESTEQADLREIYLATHHILKYRGHFTNQGQTFDLHNMDIAASLNQTLKLFEMATSFTFCLEYVDQEAANKILENPKLSKSEKAYQLNELYRIDEEVVYRRGNEAFIEDFEKKTTKQQATFIASKQKQVKALFTAIVGNKINLKDIFENSQYSEKENQQLPKNLYFKNEDFEENLQLLENFLDSEEIQVLANAKKVYESIILSTILNGQFSLSAAMVEKYQTHKQQLAELKQFTKSISEPLYATFFKKEGIYTKYIEGSGNPAKKTTLEAFYKEIKKTLEKEFSIKFPEGEKAFDFSQVNLSKDVEGFLISINNEMNVETYLPKQRMFKNGAIPYQIHETELVKIIEQQKAFYPFLGETVTVSFEDEELNPIEKIEYKIQTLMKFRIPYYVGPLTEANQGTSGEKRSDKSRFAWMQKVNNQKITPWNFEEVVDKEKSEIEFIKRMTNFCSYLPDQKVLPKNSLVYQEFTVYNELIVSGYYEKDFAGKMRKTYFGAGLMNELVEKFFKNQKKVTAKHVLAYLRNQKNIQAIEIFGVDTRTINGEASFNSSLSTFIDLKHAGITPERIERHQQKFEEIVQWQTIFEDRKVLLRKIRNANAEWHLLTDEEVKKLANRHYTGFGNLSQALIDGIRDEHTHLTILEQLKTGGYHNFMRLVSGETAENYSYKKQIEACQMRLIKPHDLSYDVVEELPGSPAIKKGIWQSLKIIKELEQVLGREKIGRIVIEMSRGNQGGRTQSRYKQLKKFYDQFDEKDPKVFEELKGYEKDEKALDKEKLYLYFTQNGKCAYTSEELKIEKFSTYQIDHIIPQSLLKDDSIDNKVLVTGDANQIKGGDVPSREVIRKRQAFWELLVKANLMSQKKLKSLMLGSISGEAREGFINRQLVENRQITKHVATILAKYFEETETVILTPKAALTSQFRQGHIFLPNPEFKEEEAKKNPKNYSVKRLKEVELHAGFPKNRELNDYHHAHDAFLNAVVANYLYLTKPELKNVWVYGKYARNDQNIFGKWARERKNKSLQLLSDMLDEVWIDKETGEIIAYRDEVLKKVEKTLNYRNVNIVKKTEMQTGKFGKESILKKDQTAPNFSSGLKRELSPNKYGGMKDPISAFTVIVKDEKGKIFSLSISAMLADGYCHSTDKLAYLKGVYPNQQIVEIIVEKVAKYTKFENSHISRLLASPEESQKSDSLTLTQAEMRSLGAENSDLIGLYDKIAIYLRKNAVYTEGNLSKWEQELKEEFLTLAWPEQAQFIKDAFSITKAGTTTAKGVIKGKIGSSNGRQRHKSKKIDLITNDTTLIYESVTGLYETRRTLM